MISAVLVPKQSLTVEQLKECGQLLVDWIVALQASGINVLCDEGPIADMLAGELPKPLALYKTDSETMGRKTLSSVRRQLGAAASARLLKITVPPPSQGGMSIDGFIRSARLYLRFDHFERIVVNDVPVKFAS